MKTDNLSYYANRCREWEEQGRSRELETGYQDGEYICVQGRRLLNLSSNDYLGIAGDRLLRQAFFSEAPWEDAAFSSASSRLLTGNDPAYAELEDLLARLYGARSALVFNSGYQMNVGILPCMALEDCLILADKAVHASLIDGIRLSPAKALRFRHGDMDHLEALLRKYASGYRAVFVVTESIFSMDGDLCPLQDMVFLKKKYPNVLLYVDEAHAVGVRGKGGLGLAQEADCLSEVDFLCGTFGKALGSVGAFWVGDSRIRQYLLNRMRSFVFTTALPPLNVTWTRFVLERLSGMEDRRNALAELVRRAGQSLEGEPGVGKPVSHIVPVLLGDDSVSMEKARELREEGFYVRAIRPPTVRQGTARLRLSLNAALPADVLGGLWDRVRVWQKSSGRRFYCSEGSVRERTGFDRD